MLDRRFFSSRQIRFGRSGVPRRSARLLADAARFSAGVFAVILFLGAAHAAALSFYALHHGQSKQHKQLQQQQQQQQQLRRYVFMVATDAFSIIWQMNRATLSGVVQRLQ